jgi:hypothetical protein
MSTQEKPNIRFVGKPQEIFGKTIEPEPFEFINNGNSAYVLPPQAEQRSGFYHPNAREIVRLHPSLYKFLIRKGK